jgi:transposase
MRIQTILNRVEKFKSFAYGDVHLEERDEGPVLSIQIKSRKNGQPFCSGCGRCGRAYDRLEQRLFEFVPILGILVFFAYRMRRVDCKRCGVTVEMVPWCDGNNQLVRDGYEPVLKSSRWCILKRPENLTAHQTVKLPELLTYNLRTMRAYLLGV